MLPAQLLPSHTVPGRVSIPWGSVPSRPGTPCAINPSLGSCGIPGAGNFPVLSAGGMLTLLMGWHGLSCAWLPPQTSALDPPCPDWFPHHC